MSQTSRPWQSTSPGDAGPYSAQQWQQLYQSLIGLGASRPNVGPLLGSGTQPNDGLKVQVQSPATTSIDVLAGSALIQGIAYINTTTVSFAIAANSSGNPRIDTVIVRADYALQTVRLAVLQGTPAVTPAVAGLTQSANVMWEIPLADIAVANGFSSITNANITPRHEWANAASGVYLDNIFNNSGGTLVTGDVVIWDTSTDRAVTTTTTANNSLIAGVWVGRTANGSYGRLLRLGVGYVNAGAAVTRGDILVNSTTAKQATANNNLVGTRVGQALETTSGSGLVLTFVNVHLKSTYPVLIQDLKNSGTAPASLTAGAWRTRELTTEVTDLSNLATLASNQITLQPGNYLAWCVASGTLPAVIHLNRLRLRNITDGATLFQGVNDSLPASNGANLSAFGFFTITAAKVIELQHYPSQTSIAGAAMTTGDQECYASVFLQKID
ncbi:MAG: hypothetical protein H0X30_01410 [Anaerolineae bacterium]|nr:hypothetical protein [Anaerolineae bacterium]